jgi:hypothetical protein
MTVLSQAAACVVGLCVLTSQLAFAESLAERWNQERLDNSRAVTNPIQPARTTLQPAPPSDPQPGAVYIDNYKPVPHRADPPVEGPATKFDPKNPTAVVGNTVYMCPYKTEKQCKDWGRKLATQQKSAAAPKNTSVVAAPKIESVTPKTARAIPATTFSETPAVDCAALRAPYEAAMLNLEFPAQVALYQQQWNSIPPQCRQMTPSQYRDYVRTSTKQLEEWNATKRNYVAATRRAQSAPSAPSRSGVNCQQILNQLTSGAAGTYERAQQLGTVYNANCLR